MQLCGTDTSTWLCAELQSDSGHCGSCSIACPAGNNCQSGVCACSTGGQALLHCPTWPVVVQQVCARCTYLNLTASLGCSQTETHTPLSPAIQTQRTATVQPLRAALPLGSHWQQVRAAADSMFLVVSHCAMHALPSPPPTMPACRLQREQPDWGRQQHQPAGTCPSCHDQRHCFDHLPCCGQRAQLRGCGLRPRSGHVLGVRGCLHFWRACLQPAGCHRYPALAVSCQCEWLSSPSNLLITGSAQAKRKRAAWDGKHRQ